MTQISKIYHSREDRIAELHGEDERMNGDIRHDCHVIDNAVAVLDEYLNNLVEDGLDVYSAAIADDAEEDQRDRELYARRATIERWALLQAALSKVAWDLRFDGNVAYERMINVLKTGAAADMRGL